MRPVVTQPRPAPAGRRGRTLALLGGGLALAFVLLVMMPALDSPAHVGQITIDNPHEWPASVDVAGAEQPDGWVGLGAVDGQASHTFQEVLDQGPHWRFRFSYGGAEGGELDMSRSELERRGWKLAVPDTFPDHMRAAGLAPSGG